MLQSEMCPRRKLHLADSLLLLLIRLIIPLRLSYILFGIFEICLTLFDQNRINFYNELNEMQCRSELDVQFKVSPVEVTHTPHMLQLNQTP